MPGNAPKADLVGSPSIQAGCGQQRGLHTAKAEIDHAPHVLAAFVLTMALAQSVSPAASPHRALQAGAQRLRYHCRLLQSVTPENAAACSGRFVEEELLPDHGKEE
jgi:hypothetical protein